jgi:UDP-N-acetylmuramate--alanine ligase
MFRGRIRSIHFVGIGGVGMSGIAEVLLEHGFSVSGSDAKASDLTRRLQEKGARISIGHRQENLGDADVVVFSSAIQADNPELVQARETSVPVIPRAEMLAELMRLKDGIAIAGSHGKTTTTSLVATIFQVAERDPTVIIGGKLNAMGSGAARGEGDVLIAEADESDGSFLHLTPTIAIITNVDAEHLDFYKTHDGAKNAFVEFANRVPFYGLVVACLDHPHVQEILPRIEKRTATYGMSAQADYRGRNVRAEGLSSRFDLTRRGEPMGEFCVTIPGRHNVLNALAAIAVADEAGIPMDVIRTALAGFRGVQRRFTVLGEVSKVTVVDDYGHHPAEIEATLAAAHAAYGRRVVVAFQPHRYSRTHLLFDTLAQSFNLADVLLVCDVYAAGEAVVPSASSSRLVHAIREHGHREASYVGARSELAGALHKRLRPGDVVVTLGAGDITKTGPELLALLRDKPLARG